ncbi:LysM peptidoglycan-binding domain-containing protein [Rossellomorea aquimaris]|uniref:C40 family peptidase n=1 Tax=Rossellomorea aquimaris TaxID=189382 RepID=UPI001CD78FA8|nr:peptidoglycan endopeptidase [Rossellomorea aquimaris]MCA1055163.1 LysM peptidoglycan-binding domain-containing protein [Rossellomorea aquimaris]
MKKTLVTVAATAVFSTSFVAEAAAATYKVQSGDSLWSIARKHDMTVSQLMILNKLQSEIIYPLQIINVSDTQVNNPDTSSKKETESSIQPQTKTYTIQSGDTLIGIANRYSIELGALKEWNNITSHIIYPGQKLVVSSINNTEIGNTNTYPSQTTTPTQKDNKIQISADYYEIKPGDTLSHISIRTGLSVTEIKKMNGLSNDNIYVGQKIRISAIQKDSPTDSKTVSSTGFNTNTLVKVATSLTGTPYVWGGSNLTGFDCSGFIYYAFSQADAAVKRLSSGGYYNRSYYVNTPSVGDLVFFENTYKKGISHLGIYLGNNQFIHAGDNGVEVTNLDNPYWKSKLDGFKRFYEL